MDQKALFFRVGIAILGGVAALVALIVWIGADTFRRPGFLFETYFAESVQGLETGAQVTFRGVTVGAVRQIAIAGAAYPQARGGVLPAQEAQRLVIVRFELFRDRVGEDRAAQFQALVDQGLRLRMASQGITGILYLEMDFVDPGRFPAFTPPWTPRYPVIPSVPSTLTQFQSAAEQLLARLNEVDLAGLVVRIGDFVSILADSVSAGEAYRLLVEGADLASALRRETERISPQLEAAALDARGTMRAARDIVEGRELRAAIANSAAATAELRAAIARLPATTAAAEATLRRIEALIADADRDLGPMLRDLRVMADNLRAMTEQMRRYPSQVLFGDPPPGGPAPPPGAQR